MKVHKVCICMINLLLSMDALKLLQSSIVGPGQFLAVALSNP